MVKRIVSLRRSLLHTLNFSILLLSSFLQNLFLQKSFRNTFKMSIGFDPSQDRPSTGCIGPDLGPNLFARVIS